MLADNLFLLSKIFLGLAGFGAYKLYKISVLQWSNVMGPNPTKVYMPVDFFHRMVLFFLTHLERYLFVFHQEHFELTDADT